MKEKQLFTANWFVLLGATLCCLLWGSAYPAIKIGYEYFHIAADDLGGKFLFAGYRFTLAGLFVLILSACLKKPLMTFPKKVWGEICILGFCQTTLQYIFFYIGLAYSSGVRSSILNGTGAFFSILLAHFIYKNEKLGIAKALGCLIGFAGIVLINLDGGNSLFAPFSFEGDGCVILSAFILSAASIYGKKIMKNYDSFVITGYQLTIGGLILIVLGMCFGSHIGPFTMRSVGLLIYMAALSSVAFSVWAVLMKYNHVGKVAIYNSLIPIFGAFLSAIFLKENAFEVKYMLALVLVCIGIFIVNYTFKPNKTS